MTTDKRDILERLRATDDPLAQWAADEIERLQAELTALKGDGWQSMDTAPKHGHFLATVADGVRLVSWGKTSHVPLYGWILVDQGVEDCDLCLPTAWMPLPSTFIADQRARKTVCCYLGVKPTFRCPDCPHDSALSSQQRGET